MIVGGDMLENFKYWKYPERILNSAKLAVFSREDFNLSFEKERKYFKDTFNKDFTLLKYGGKSCSSTKIRIYSAFSLDVRDFTNEKVANYIKENKLYKGNEYQELISLTLKPSRVKHTANVVVCALKKVKELGLEEEKVITATTLHDLAKYIDYKTVKGFRLPTPDMPDPVIHAFLGGYLAQNKLGIKDTDIINAVRYHTSGRANMSNLEKLVFVADMIEEDRNYLGVEKLREYYEQDFEKCFIECIKEEMIHLENKKTPIYGETINCYNYYVK
jgi:predicted HD superfamily hydrolase involved in NAD metabolism